MISYAGFCFCRRVEYILFLGHENDGIKQRSALGRLVYQFLCGHALLHYTSAGLFTGNFFV